MRLASPTTADSQKNTLNALSNYGGSPVSDGNVSQLGSNVKKKWMRIPVINFRMHFEMLKKEMDAKGNSLELAGYLNQLYSYIAESDELTWEGIVEKAQPAVA